ncbi:MAG: ATP-binding cassette domain-containing protein [Defluviitaleaceae bacterium]|nr:ATP-binding cassette domain-containing protein [Defluviitaleaceae bacterium]MCL2262294.1 ATP-binding cassette domain-containing protein [Defluviitaleaceae bacterium]
MIEVKNITQSYGKNVDILKDINFTVRENCVTALVGANGAGKSTLLSVIANLIPARSGEVLIDGKAVAKIKTADVAKKVAFLKQSQHFDIRIPVKDVVEFGRFPHCGGRMKDADNKKVSDALEYMDLKYIAHKYIDEISGGQRQRAFIAMILAQDTPYIFLDEPLNNLDMKYSVEMMKIVKKLVTDLGKTIVVVLHDINFASAYADHIIAMKDGKIHKEGSPAEIVNSEILNPVFGHEFNIVERDGKRVCLYFN